MQCHPFTIQNDKSIINKIQNDLLSFLIFFLNFFLSYKGYFCPFESYEGIFHITPKKKFENNTNILRNDSKILNVNKICVITVQRFSENKFQEFKNEVEKRNGM